MSKKVKIIILCAGIAAILIAAGVYSLVSFLNYNAIRSAAEAAIKLDAFR